MGTITADATQFVSRYEEKTVNISCASLVSGSTLQEKKFL
jgi:hypothetical protein